MKATLLPIGAVAVLIVLAGPLSVGAQVSEADSLALVALYNSTDGPNWIKQTNWLSGPVSTWQGVGVSDGRVKSLFHIEDNMTGQIPPEIGDLTAIEFINIYCNKLSGPLPPEIGNLTELHTLILSINDLSGGIPDELSNLKKMRKLLLGVNHFTGEIPSWVGDMSELELLFLFRNDFAGTIPPELGKLSKLKELELSENQLTGTLPPELGDLDSLSYLSVGSQPLQGPLPQSLTGLSRLSLLHYANTEICEPGDAEFQNWLNSIEDLESTGIPCVSSTATESADVAPTMFRLVGNYPNPFNPSTTIQYDVAEATSVRITIFDGLGRVVESIVNSHQSLGRHSVAWSARDFPSGTYFVRMEAGEFSDVGKMALVQR